MTEKTIQAIIEVFDHYPILTILLLLIIGSILALTLVATGRLTIGRRKRYEHQNRISDSFALGQKKEYLKKDRIRRQMDEADQTISRIEDIALKHFLKLKKKKRGSKEGLLEDKETGHYGAFLRAGLEKTKEKYLFFIKKNHFAELSEPIFRNLVDENTQLLIKEMTDYLNFTWRGEDIPYQEIKEYKDEVRRQYEGKVENDVELIHIIQQHIVEFVEDWHKNRTISREELYDHNVLILPEIEKEIHNTLWDARNIAMEIEEELKEVDRKLQELKGEPCSVVPKRSRFHDEN